MAKTFGVTDQNIASGVRASAPTQLGSTSDITEWKNSREITLDYQKGIIAHTYDIPGNPPEAVLSEFAGDAQVGNLHPWAGKDDLGGAYDHHYLTKQSYKHLARSSDKDRRWTRVTSIYEQRPCPGAYEETTKTVIRPIMEWYPRQQPPEGERWMTISGTAQPIPVPTPRVVVVRKYLRVKLTPLKLMALASDVGKVAVNRGRVNGHEGKFFMFEGLEARMLFGTWDNGAKEYTEAYYEITLFLEGDFYRKHEFWFPIWGPNSGLPKNSHRDTPREDLHVAWKMFEVLPEGRDINNLLGGAPSTGNCAIASDE